MAGTRERILATALGLFSSRGFNGTGMKELTRAAAVPTGSVYHFFPGGKNELAVAAIRESGSENEAHFVTIAAQHAEPGAAVKVFFCALADLFEQVDFVDLCPIGTIAGEVASSSDDLRMASDAVFRSWASTVVTVLTAAGLAEHEAGELAETVVATMLGGFITVRSRRDGAPLRAAGRQLEQLIDGRVARSSLQG